MGRKSSRSRVEEAQAAASDAREHAEVAGEASQVQVGGDASALASMFALSGSVFAKKASYASAAEPKKGEAKATKATGVKAAVVKAAENNAPKKLKKKEKKKQQQAAAEEKAAAPAAAAGEDKAAAKKQKKKNKKRQQAQVETEESGEKPAAKKQKKQEKETAVEKAKKTVDAATDADAEAAKKQKKKDKKKQKKLQAKLAASEKKEQAESTPAEKATTKKTKEVKEIVKREMSPEDEAKSRRTIFVGNVSLEATEKDVARHFAPCGKVESVRLRNMPVAGCKVDQAGNQKLMMKVCANKKIFTEKGETCNAYVVFASEESIPAALALNGSTLLSKKLRVDRESLVIDPKRSVFVGGIAFQLPDDQLRAFFNSRLRTDEEPEPVEHVRIIRDRETGIGKGFGYVLLKTQSLAAKALSLHETKLGTRQIRVQVSGKRFKNRRGEETDPSKKHEGLRAAAGARARIQLKRKTRQGSEVSSSKRQKLEEAVKTIKPKHAARKARQAAEAAAGGAPSADSKKSGKSGKSAKGAKRAKGDDGKRKHKSDRSSKKPKVKVQKPKHAARKARQAAEAAAKAAPSS